MFRISKPKSRRRSSPGLSFLATLACAAPAYAQQQPSGEGTTPAGDAALPRIGMAAGEPQSPSAPPSVPFGIPPSESPQYVLDFHGYLLVPLRVGVHEREDPLPGQSDTVLHTPPLIPQDLRSFEYTGVVPTPWAQLNFTYGNSTISGTAILAARAFTDATGLFDPVEQIGLTDAFVSVNLTKPMGTPFEVKVGAMTGRYGIMGMYDMGRYGTPLIARTNSVGESVTVGFRTGQTTFVIEQGLGGQINRSPRGIVPAGWNDFGNPETGTSFVTQLHGGLSYADRFQLGLHYLAAFSQDDRSETPGSPDGRIVTMGADARLTAGRYGHLYAGVARTTASNSGVVGGVIEILNARGGPELIEEYLGPDSGGDGALTVFGAQYDLSTSRLVFGDKFKGTSPDLLFSLFGMAAAVESDDDVADGTLKLKGGFETTYTMLRWFGLGARVDHVRLDNDEDRQSFNVISPRLLFHTDWQSRDQIVLQYSYFGYGGDVQVQTGFPPVDDPSANPDKHVFSLSAIFWW